MGTINSVHSFVGIDSMVGASIEPEYLGATMVFAQAVAPAGWTKQTSYHDYALRIVAGSTGGVATAGTSTFGTLMSNNYTAFPVRSGPWPLSSDVTTINTTTMESHSHPRGGSAFIYGSWGANPAGPAIFYYASPMAPNDMFVQYTGPTSSAGSGGGHSHGVTLNSISYSSPFSFNVKYIDVILAKYH